MYPSVASSTVATVVASSSRRMPDSKSSSSSADTIARPVSAVQSQVRLQMNQSQNLNLNPSKDGVLGSKWTASIYLS